MNAFIKRVTAILLCGVLCLSVSMVSAEEGAPGDVVIADYSEVTDAAEDAEPQPAEADVAVTPDATASETPELIVGAEDEIVAEAATEAVTEDCDEIIGKPSDDAAASDEDVIPQSNGTNASYYTVVNGVLTNYTGPGGNVVIPDDLGIKALDDELFWRCNRSFDKLTLPEGLTKIGVQTFWGTTINTIVLPKSLRQICEYAFWGSTLKSVAIPSGVTRIDDNAFWACKSLKTVSLPASVKTLGNMIFSDCTSLTKVTFAKNSKKIGQMMFMGCTALKTISLPSGMTTIDQWAFSGCTALKSITVPASVTTINSWAFEGCGALTSVALKEGLKKLDGWAFKDCKKLKAISLPKSLKTIGYDVFSGHGSSLKIYCWSGSVADQYAVTNKIGRVLVNVSGYVGPTLTLSANGTRKMYVGDQVLVSVKGSALKSVATSNKSVATASAAGLVTAQKAGKATITFTPKKGSKRTLTLTVYDPSIPTSITLNQSGTQKLYTYPGDTLTAKATVKGCAGVISSPKVTWKSSNTAVASVKNGVVTPRKVGAAKITATSGTKSASFKVKVIDPTIPKSLKFAEGTEAAVGVNDSLQLTVKATYPYPSVYAQDSAEVTWSVEDESIASVSGAGLISGKKAGATRVTATSVKNTALSCTIQITVE